MRLPNDDPRRDWPTDAWVLVLCSLLLAPTLAYRMGVDQGVFAYMGAELLEGRWPYIGTWESDFPGMVLLQAGEIALFGKSIAMFRLFDLLFQLANAFLVYRIGRAVGSSAGAILGAGTYCLIYQGYGPWNTAQREGFALLFILWGVWLFVTAGRRSPAVTAALIGLGFGVAVTFKPTLLALATLYLPLAGWLNRKTIRVAAGAVAGLLAPTVAIILAYLAMGGLTDLYEACIAHQAVYTQLLARGGPLWRDWLGRLGSLGGTTVVLAVVFPLFLGYEHLCARRRGVLPADRRGIPVGGGGRRRLLHLMLYFGYLGSILSVLAQGTFAGYHYLPGLALGAVMIGTMFSQAIDFVRTSPRFVALGGSGAATRPVGKASRDMVLAHVLLLAALPIYVRSQPLVDLVTLHFLEPPRVGEFRNGTVFDFTEAWDVAQYLRANTSADETVQVWGYESLVYYLAERGAASRFQTSSPLVMRVPGEALTSRQLGWRREFMRDVTRETPRFVLVVREDDWWWAPGRQTSEELLDSFPEWKGFIEANYEIDTTIGRFLVYRWQGGPAEG